MKILLSAAAMAMALTALAGCSGDDDGDTADGPGHEVRHEPPNRADRRTRRTSAAIPEFDATDYTYLLEQQFATAR